MALHYLGDIKHMTCQTAKGYRRSPLSDISYNSGQALTDNYNNHTYHRKHYDGTQIIDTDIVSTDKYCTYADNSIPSAERRCMMYNDLYRLNKNNTERVYWKTEIALPNGLTDEQLKEISREIALSFSAYLHRPIDYSIHKKTTTKNKPANNHMHLASPERIYDNGKWGGKSTSYYIDKQGNLIYDKNYKDANGNDIRKPRTIGNAEPVEAINPNTGLKYYVNQRKDGKGRLQWKKTDINALDKDALQWMHNEIDRIQNKALVRYGIDDRIQRNDKRTTHELQQAGIKAQHIGKRDMEKQGESYQEKLQLNQQYEFFKNTFNATYKKLDAAEHALAAAERDEAVAIKEHHSVVADIAKVNEDKERLQSEFNTTIIDYIENELQPEEIFVQHSVTEFNKSVELARKNASDIITTMNNGIAAVNNDIKNFNRKNNPTDKELLTANYIKTNGNHMERYRNAADRIYSSSISAERIKTSARKRWRRSQGWLTRNYIRKVMDKEIADLYEMYLFLKKLITREEKNNNKYLYPVTCDHAIRSIIMGKSVPGIKLRIDSNQSWTDNAIRITSETNSQYDKDAQSELHLPPASVEPLILWHNVPERMIQLTSGDKLTNLKQGTLSASSTDAVTGAQLYATNHNISGFATDINRNKENIRELNTNVTAALESVSSMGYFVDNIDRLKADSSLNNLTAIGRQVIANEATNAVQKYLSANPVLNASRPVTDSALSSPSNTLNITDAGNGSLHVGEGSSVNGTSSIAIGVGNQVNANNAGAFGDPSIINADASYVLGNDDTVNTGAVNSFIVGNDSVSNAEGSLIMGNHVTSNGKNGMALGNSSNVSAENAIALGYGSAADEENTLSIGNSTLKRRITNMADGNLSYGSSDAVTGSQLYTTNERVKANEEAITKKADTDASNIDIDKWTEKLGTGKIEDGNGGLVTGGTVYDAVTNMKDAITNASPVKADGDNIFIGSDMGGNTISVANNKGDGRIITGVATNPQDASSAANVGYVNAVGQNIVQGVSEAFTRVNDRMDKVGAGAAAMAGLVPGSFEEDTKWNLSASVGNYRSATAGAVGAFYKPTGNVTIALKGSFGNGENMVSGGVGVALNKGDVPGVTKRQLAAEVVNLKAAREQDRAVIADQSARIERLEAALQQVLAERKDKE